MLNFTIIGRSYAVVKRERETLCTICSVSLRSHVLQDRHRQERDGDVEQTQNIVTKEPPFPAAPTPSPAPAPTLPGNHKSSFHFYSFIISRVLCKWLHALTHLWRLGFLPRRW